jgi:hypothetical protein
MTLSLGLGGYETRLQVSVSATLALIRVTGTDFGTVRLELGVWHRLPPSG